MPKEQGDAKGWNHMGMVETEVRETGPVEVSHPLPRELRGLSALVVDASDLIEDVNLVAHTGDVDDDRLGAAPEELAAEVRDHDGRPSWD